MKEVFIIFVGGGSGSVLRYFFSKWFTPLFGTFPLSTFLSNLVACTIFAVVAGFSFQKMELEDSYKKLILTGFCGGLSTFSTFNAELFSLIKSENYLMAFIYLIISLVACFATFFAVVQMTKLSIPKI